jgi:hypothetical protein
MKTNVAKTLTNFNKNSQSLQRFSDISHYYRKLDEFLLKFVNVLATLVIIIVRLMNCY